MKYLIIFSFFAIFCTSCDKGDFDIKNPDVRKFVEQLKNGSYDEFETGENGERLWAKMPDFQMKDVQLLISLSKDTEMISPCDHFPVNPMSSIPPYRFNNGKESIMIGEFLLWCVEAIIEGRDFASLTPVLVDLKSNPDDRLTGEEVLAVRKIYRDWWERNGHLEDRMDLPLDGTEYCWR